MQNSFDNMIQQLEEDNPLIGLIQKAYDMADSEAKGWWRHVASFERDKVTSVPESWTFAYQQLQTLKEFLQPEYEISKDGIKDPQSLILTAVPSNAGLKDYVDVLVLLKPYQHVVTCLDQTVSQNGYEGNAEFGLMEKLFGFESEVPKALHLDPHRYGGDKIRWQLKTYPWNSTKEGFYDSEYSRLANVLDVADKLRVDLRVVTAMKKLEEESGKFERNFNRYQKKLFEEYKRKNR